MSTLKETVENVGLILKNMLAPHGVAYALVVYGKAPSDGAGYITNILDRNAAKAMILEVLRLSEESPNATFTEVMGPN